VTVTINGSEDAAVIGGTATGTVAEDGTPSASDTLTITDHAERERHADHYRRGYLGQPGQLQRRRRHPGRQRLR
jgi:hypothetical protein